MAVTSYLSVNGKIHGQVSAGSATGYTTDALGSVVATVDNSGSVANTYRYKPYGATLAKTGSSADPKSQWVGSWGYRSTGRTQSDSYVRARHYGQKPGMWTTVDPLWPEELAFVYGYGNPTSTLDPTGKFPVVCVVACGLIAAAAINMWLMCKDWKEERWASSFTDCAMKIWDEFDGSLKFGASIALDGCLSCLGNAASKAFRCKAPKSPEAPGLVPKAGGPKGGWQGKAPPNTAADVIARMTGCTWKEYAKLKIAKTIACNVAGCDRSAKLPCSVVWTRILAAEECQRVRAKIHKKCFKGIESPKYKNHPGEVAGTAKKIRDCYSALQNCT